MYAEDEEGYRQSQITHFFGKNNEEEMIPEIYPEERNNETRILAINANGYPSNKANKHKLKQMNEMMQENDVLLALETGINDLSKPRNISDSH